MKFCNSPCRDNLHAYWDDLLGTTTSSAAIAHLGDGLLQAGKPPGADVTDVAAWIKESFDLAQKDAYRAPISADNDPSVKLSPRPNQAYQNQAESDAKARVLLAGYRLAELLNAHLK